MAAFWHAIVTLDAAAIVQAGGYVAVGAFIFAESGLLVGIFLPGDSLLFAAGLLAATGALSYPGLVALVVVAAVAGDSTGYWLGAVSGRRLYERPDSRLFKHAYLTRTEAFYAHYGARAVMLARFVPIVRTIAPLLAGVGRMPYARFLSYNVIGGALWGAGVLSAGYFLGAAIPGIQHYLLPISLLIIALSLLPLAAHLLANRRAP